MKNLIDIQEKFNNVFDFSKLKESTKKYIERILTESEDEFFFDYSTNKNEIQRLAFNPSLLINFDDKMLISQYAEPESFEVLFQIIG